MRERISGVVRLLRTTVRTMSNAIPFARSFHISSNRNDTTMPSAYLALMIVLFAITAVPHFMRMHPALTAYVLAIVGFKIWALWKNFIPKKWHIATLSICYAICVLVLYGRIAGHEAGSVFLMGLLAVKLLESHSYRDVMICAFLAYFLVALNFLFSQSIPIGLWLVVQVILITFCLMSINQHHPLSLATAQPRCKMALTITMQAMPIAIILFILFPRIPGPLWALPERSNMSRTGFSDEMRPGQVSELVKSGGTAFRVQFNQSTPDQRSLYWRGLTLWRYDGYTWSQYPEYTITSKNQRPTQRQPLLNTSRTIDYTVTLEPHSMRSLFTLDMPSTFSHTDNQYEPKLDDLYQLFTNRDVTQVFKYDVTSHLNYAQGVKLNPLHKTEALYFPITANPLAQQLAQQWQQNHADKSSIVQTALRYFTTNNFVYSLTPPLLNKTHGVDDFLFNKQTGFCEHYAGAFAFLMRAAGIPSRVVVGYQGGEVNPITQELTVRQSDAHAWAEVWLDGKGWVRIDPTSAVSPERVEQSLASAVSDTELNQLPVFGRGSGSRLKPLLNLWDALDSQWNQLILGYGPKKQRDFLAKLGLKSITHIIIAMMILVGGCLGVLAYVSFRKEQSQPRPPLDTAFDALCSQLDKTFGIKKMTGEPALEYAKRVSRAHDCAEFIAIANAYNALRYGNNHEVHSTLKSVEAHRWQATIQQFKQRIKKL